MVGIIDYDQSYEQDTLLLEAFLLRFASRRSILERLNNNCVRCGRGS